MLKSKLLKKGKGFEKLKKHIKNLNNQQVSVGHFNQQGLHHSGMTYPALLAFWFIGVPQEGLASMLRQDVRGQFSFNYFESRKIAFDPKMKLALDSWAKRSEAGDATASLLDDIGEILRREYSLTFNVRDGPFMLGTKTPLFETGELAGTSAYKTSKSATVKEL